MASGARGSLPAEATANQAQRLLRAERLLEYSAPSGSSAAIAVVGVAAREDHTQVGAHLTHALPRLRSAQLAHDYDYVRPCAIECS